MSMSFTKTRRDMHTNGAVLHQQTVAIRTAKSALLFFTCDNIKCSNQVLSLEHMPFLMNLIINFAALLTPHQQCQTAFEDGGRHAPAAEVCSQHPPWFESY